MVWSLEIGRFDGPGDQKPMHILYHFCQSEQTCYGIIPIDRVDVIGRRSSFWYLLISSLVS